MSAGLPTGSAASRRIELDLKNGLGTADAMSMDQLGPMDQVGTEWRRLEESVAEIGGVLEHLAERVAEWGRSLDAKASEMRAGVEAVDADAA